MKASMLCIRTMLLPETVYLVPDVPCAAQRALSQPQAEGSWSSSDVVGRLLLLHCCECRSTLYLLQLPMYYCS